MDWRSKDIRALIEEGNITCLEDLTQTQDYPTIKAEIDGFLRRTIEESIGHVDTIVGVERKGSRILRNFFAENPKLNKFNIVRDNMISQTIIEDMDVLIFDDTIREGEQILGIMDRIFHYSPSKLSVGCLLCNNLAFNNISTRYPEVIISPCKTYFESYVEQSKWYNFWLMPYLDKLKIKDNPDYPSLTMKTQSQDLSAINDALLDALRGHGKIEVSYQNGFTPGSKDCICGSVDIEPGNMIHPQCESMVVSNDASKIRFFIASYVDRTEIEVIPIINLRYNTSECTLKSVYPERCLSKVKNIENGDGCGVCLSRFVNREAIDKIHPGIIDTFQERGIHIFKREIEDPDPRDFIS
jgi:hypothetical protein